MANTRSTDPDIGQEAFVGADLDEKQYPLHTAALAGDYIRLQEGLNQKKNVQVDGLCAAGRSPLLYAVISGAKSCVDLLLQSNANIFLQDSSGLGVCHWAASQEAHKMLKYLIDKGAPWDIKDDGGRTALHWCTLSESTKSLHAVLKMRTAEEPGDLDVQDNNGMTALHWSTFYNKPKHVALLLRAGASAELADSNGKTPLHWVAENGDAVNTENLLSIEGAPVNAISAEGRTPLLAAVASGHEEIVSMLCKYPGIEINLRDSVGRTPLHWASASSQISITRILLSHGAQTEPADQEGATALHYAAQAPVLEVVEEILRYGSKHLPDHDGRYPLHWAVMKGNVTVIEMLLHYGHDPNLADVQGRSALHFAAAGDKVDIVEILVSAGADINSLDKQGQSVLLTAVELGGVEMTAAIINLGADVKCFDSEGRSPLHWAAVNGHRATIDLILDRKFDIDAKDGSGKTSLAYACHQRHLSSITALISRKADVNVQDNDGITALHWAALQGYLDVVKVLVKADAFLNFREFKDPKSTPLDYARSSGHDDVVAYLESKGGLGISELRHIAAVNIQCEWRRYQARKTLEQLKGEKLAEKASKDQHAAATLISKMYRGHHTRKHILPKLKEERNSQLEEAAIKIQATWRGHQTRKGLGIQKKSSKKSSPKKKKKSSKDKKAKKKSVESDGSIEESATDTPLQEEVSEPQESNQKKEKKKKKSKSKENPDDKERSENKEAVEIVADKDTGTPSVTEPTPPPSPPTIPEVVIQNDDPPPIHGTPTKKASESKETTPKREKKKPSTQPDSPQKEPSTTSTTSYSSSGKRRFFGKRGKKHSSSSPEPTEPHGKEDHPKTENQEEQRDIGAPEIITQDTPSTPRPTKVSDVDPQNHNLQSNTSAYNNNARVNTLSPFSSEDEAVAPSSRPTSASRPKSANRRTRGSRPTSSGRRSAQQPPQERPAPKNLMEAYTRYMRDAPSRRENDRVLLRKLMQPLGNTTSYNELASNANLTLIVSKKQHNLRLQESEKRAKFRRANMAAKVIQRAWRTHHKIQTALAQDSTAANKASKKLAIRQKWDVTLESVMSEESLRPTSARHYDTVPLRSAHQSNSHDHQQLRRPTTSGTSRRTQSARTHRTILTAETLRPLPNVAKKAHAYNSPVWDSGPYTALAKYDTTYKTPVSSPSRRKSLNSTSATRLQLSSSSTKYTNPNSGITLTPVRRPKSGIY